ncbi:hypothetical protein llap_9224 [Limosa lapponica baueri]|uniref:Uncharacterized protein n=1 Tax=Limosa lapponica baueri TaxID=1758121 RepID=A0A2I0U3C6_LIMLA|nr:hypothetical protein llap_9224 [Limosa lapponica baueri]
MVQRSEKNSKTLKFNGNGEYPFQFVSRVQTRLRKKKSHISKAKETLDMLERAMNMVKQAEVKQFGRTISEASVTVYPHFAWQGIEYPLKRKTSPITYEVSVGEKARKTPYTLHRSAGWQRMKNGQEVMEPIKNSVLSGWSADTDMLAEGTAEIPQMWWVKFSLGLISPGRKRKEKRRKKKKEKRRKKEKIKEKARKKKKRRRKGNKEKRRKKRSKKGKKRRKNQREGKKKEKIKEKGKKEGKKEKNKKAKEKEREKNNPKFLNIFRLSWNSDEEMD